MKKFRTVIVLLLCVSLLSACSVPLIGKIGKKSEDDAPDATPAPEPLDLSGEWVQVNSQNENDYQGIRIHDDYIEIFWVLGSSGGAALYWAGSFTPPPEKTTVNDKYEWESETDTSRTAKSLLTDKSPTKTFSYEDGKLVYQVDYEEMVMTVKAEKRDWSNHELEYFGTVDVFDMVNGVYREYVTENPVEETESE